MQILLRTYLPGRTEITVEAAARGADYLARSDDPTSYPGMWHAKDLFAPVNVIRAARLAALGLAERRRQPAHHR